MALTDNIPRVKKLADAVINQIAAGEVIERPVSVVKELIENSIDAAATAIHINIEQAGNSLISVRDDGHGIHKDDLKLALTKHTTSKLTAFADLEELTSLGFRGEAIPSIASVSRFKLTSRPQHAETAWSIDNHFNLKPEAHTVGTTVEVSDLFFATPGRRKFLKSERTEYLHIQAFIRAVALSHFSVGFVLKHNDQPALRLPLCTNDFERRVKQVCGRTFLTKSHFIDVSNNGLRLWGWLGLGEVARSQSDRQYFYVNGRMVRDKHVNHAIRLAYMDNIAIGRFPSYILHLELDPNQVDVNVHPAKTEVRFLAVREVHDFIHMSLLDSLNKKLVFIETGPDYKTTQTTLPTAPMAPTTIAPRPAPRVTEQTTAHYHQSLFKTEHNKAHHSTINYFKLLHGQFVVAYCNKNYLLVDIAQARSTLAAQHLLKHFRADTMVTHPIMIPLGLELADAQLNLILREAVTFRRWGFELAQISPKQISIRALPARLLYADAIAVVKRLLTLVENHDSETTIAKQLAGHVNDAGIQLDDTNMMQLIGEIAVFEGATEDIRPSPWRRLDAQSLQSLLNN